MAAPAVLPGFTQLNDSVYFRREQHDAPLAQDLEALTPDLILLLSWGGAPIRNVAKYTSKYGEMFPSVPLLLVRTEFSHIYKHTPTSQDRALAPVIPIIREQLQLGKQDDSLSIGKPRLLVHVFSNGGFFKLVEIAKRYRSKCGSALPVDTLYVDSAPGIPTIRKSVKAFSYALPKLWFVRLPAIALVYFGLFVFRVYQRIFGKESIMIKMRRRLNDAKLIDKSSKRCYIYSPEDELVGWKDVQDHASDARLKGFDAHEEMFNGSQHVAHAKFDPKRYWQIIQHHWTR